LSLSVPDSSHGLTIGTQCRKQTGAILFTATTIGIKDFKWDTPDGLKSYPMSPSAYKTFESSPGIIRGFCKECGGSLTWYDTKRSDIEVLVGSVDDIKGAGFEITNTVYRVVLRHWSDGRVFKRMRFRGGKLDRGR
jgi:hypothetical protein